MKRMLILMAVLASVAAVTNVTIIPISKYPNTNNLPQDALFIVALTNPALDGISAPTNKNIRYSDLRQIITNSLATTQYVQSAVAAQTNFWIYTNSRVSTVSNLPGAIPDLFVSSNLLAGGLIVEGGVVFDALATNNFLLTINGSGVVGTTSPVLFTNQLATTNYVIAATTNLYLKDVAGGTSGSGTNASLSGSLGIGGPNPGNAGHVKVYGGDLFWSSDGGGNIGQNGALRPDRIFFKTALQGADGTLAVPAYSFGSETTTGFRRSGTGVVILGLEQTDEYQWSHTAFIALQGFRDLGSTSIKWQHLYLSGTANAGSGIFSSTVNATNGFQVGSAVGLTTNINVIMAGNTTNQLQFTKGILTGVVPQ